MTVKQLRGEYSLILSAINGGLNGIMREAEKRGIEYKEHKHYSYQLEYTKRMTNSLKLVFLAAVNGKDDDDIIEFNIEGK